MKVLVIAEAGVNHNGSVARAKELVDAATESGADYVKFQTFSAKSLAHQDAEKADYQQVQTGGSESQYEMLRKLELKHEEFAELKSHCDKKNMGFLSTAFDLQSLQFILDLGVDYLKVPSGEITNFRLLKQMALANKPTLISTGMCYLKEVEAAVEWLVKSGLERSQLSVFHCNTEYPTPMKDVNLKAMRAMGEKLGLPYGYSDHTMGIEVPIAAVALGATVIEKHFTLDRSLPGPDHQSSLEPRELKKMVDGIRNIAECLGSDVKEPSASESKNREVARRAIYAKKDINVGDRLGDDNMVLLRPATGLTADCWYEIEGKPAQRSYQAGQAIAIEEVSS